VERKKILVNRTSIYLGKLDGWPLKEVQNYFSTFPDHCVFSYDYCGECQYDCYLTEYRKETEEEFKTRKAIKKKTQEKVKKEKEKDERALFERLKKKYG